MIEVLNNTTDSYKLSLRHWSGAGNRCTGIVGMPGMPGGDMPAAKYGWGMYM